MSDRHQGLVTFTHLTITLHARSELPSNFINKKVGPGKFLPALVLGFGLCSFLVAYTHNFGGIFALRFLLGVFEAGFFRQSSGCRVHTLARRC